MNRWLMSRLTGLKRSARRSPFRRPRPGVRLALDPLEDRATPAMFTVTNLSDAGAGSLRDAIDLANVTPGADVIDFAPAIRGGTVKLTTFFNPPTSSVVSGATFNPAGPTGLIVFDEVTIQGAGETITRDGAAPPFRLFQVASTGKLTLENLTLTNGRAFGGMGNSGGGGAAGLGGAIYNQGSLAITGSTLSGNTAEGNLGFDSVAPNIFGRGAAGWAATSPSVNGGGPNGGLVVGTGSPRSPGFGGGGAGGNFGAGNQPQNGGFGGGGGGGFGGFGGGRGGFGGGGGAGFAPAAGAGVGGFGGGNGSIDVIGNGGGGAGMGGAIFNQGGTVTIANSTITGNTAVGGEGNGDSQQGGGFGGGVFNLNGTLTLTNVTFANNVVSNGIFGGANVAEGGAVYNLSINVGADTPTQTATVTVANSILANSRVGLASTERTPDVVNNQVNGTATVNATGPNIASAAVVNTGGTVTGTAFTVANPNFGIATEQRRVHPDAVPEPGQPGDRRRQQRRGHRRRPDHRPARAGVPPHLERGRGPRGLRGPGAGRREPRDPAERGRERRVQPDADRVRRGPVHVHRDRRGAAAGDHSRHVRGADRDADAGRGVRVHRDRDQPDRRDRQPGVHPDHRPAAAAPAATAQQTPQPAAVGGPLDGTARVLTPSGGKYDLGGSLSFFPGLPVNVRTATADVTGDGVPDFIGGTGPGAVTRVAVIDGATNKEVVSFSPFESAFTGGVYVAAAGHGRGRQGRGGGQPRPGRRPGRGRVRRVEAGRRHRRRRRADRPVLRHRRPGLPRRRAAGPGGRDRRRQGRT